jgi:hypothetical protein
MCAMGKLFTNVVPRVAAAHLPMRQAVPGEFHLWMEHMRPKNVAREIWASPFEPLTHMTPGPGLLFPSSKLFVPQHAPLAFDSRAASEHNYVYVTPVEGKQARQW